MSRLVSAALHLVKNRQHYLSAGVNLYSYSVISAIFVDFLSSAINTYKVLLIYPVGKVVTQYVFSSDFCHGELFSDFCHYRI